MAIDRSKYELCMHPSVPDMPYELYYEGIRVAKFDWVGLSQRFGKNGAIDYLNVRIAEMMGVE